MVLGALLLGASELTASLGYDEQAAEVHAPRVRPVRQGGRAQRPGLLCDASRPGDDHNNADEWLAGQVRQSVSVGWPRIGGGVLVGLGLVALGFRIRRRFAAPRLAS